MTKLFSNRQKLANGSYGAATSQPRLQCSKSRLNFETVNLLFRDVICFFFLSSLYFQMSQNMVFDPYEYEQGRVLLNNAVNDPDCIFLMM